MAGLNDNEGDWCAGTQGGNKESRKARRKIYKMVKE